MSFGRQPPAASSSRLSFAHPAVEGDDCSWESLCCGICINECPSKCLLTHFVGGDDGAELGLIIRIRPFNYVETLGETRNETTWVGQVVALQPLNVLCNCPDRCSIKRNWVIKLILFGVAHQRSQCGLQGCSWVCGSLNWVKFWGKL